MRELVIIGNGIAGVTLAIESRKHHPNIPIKIISKESRYFFSRPALMYLFMGHMKFSDTKPFEDSFWAKNNITLLFDEILQIEPARKTLQLKSGPLSYDTLVLATGSKPKRFGWPGQDLNGVQGLYHLQDLQTLDKTLPRIQKAVIVGGGLIGVELAEMLLSRKIPVLFLVREKKFWDNVLPSPEASLITEHLQSHNLDLRFEEELAEIHGNNAGEVVGVTTKNGENISCEFVGLTVGVTPNIDFLRSSGIECRRGVLIDSKFQTSLPQVYAIGDCAEFKEPLEGRPAIEQVWYTGKMHGETLAKQLFSDTNALYNPGIWWNSAKFFDIEYQTYGRVLPQPELGTHSFFWQSPCKTKAIHFHFLGPAGALLGVNLLGLRGRHDVFEKWIHEKAPITEVLQNLGAANFDPEFFRQHEKEILHHWNTLNPHSPLTLKTPKGLFSNFWRRHFQNSRRQNAN